jgi:polyisoprenoid-binding protein YceI
MRISIVKPTRNELTRFLKTSLIIAICSMFASIAAASDPPAKTIPKNPAAPGLPAAGKYQVDPVHSFAYFGARHHVVGLVRGRFEKVEGKITVSPDLTQCGVDIAIDTSTIRTQEQERDDDLRSPDFFDVKKFPTMTYQGRGIRRVSKNEWRIVGTLTIRGVSKVVPLIFTFKGIFPDTKPSEPTRVAFHGTAATKRGDFGMTRDNVMELGIQPAPGPDVEIQIDVEADQVTPH